MANAKLVVKKRGDRLSRGGLGQKITKRGTQRGQPTDKSSKGGEPKVRGRKKRNVQQQKKGRQGKGGKRNLFGKKDNYPAGGRTNRPI